MRLLLDANLSPRIADSLSAAGFDAVHVADLGLVTATDDEIFDRAAEQGLVVVTADSDVGVARDAADDESLGRSPPSRRGTGSRGARSVVGRQPRPDRPDLDRGAIVSLSPTRLAVRDLPLR